MAGQPPGGQHRGGQQDPLASLVPAHRFRDPQDRDAQRDPAEIAAQSCASEDSGPQQQGQGPVQIQVPRAHPLPRLTQQRLGTDHRGQPRRGQQDPGFPADKALLEPQLSCVSPGKLRQHHDLQHEQGRHDAEDVRRG